MTSITDSPFEVKTSEKFGRYLVAIKDLPGGTLVFEETPLFIYSEFSDICPEWEGSKSCCISCYKIVKSKSVVKCKKCKWDFCSLECSQDPCHRKGECEILSENEILPSTEAAANLYLLRFEMLKKKQRKKWDEVMNLASKAGADNLENNDYIFTQAFNAHGFLKDCDFPVSLEHVTEVINIFRINAFSIHAGIDQSFVGVYKVCCLFAHSCCPNIDWFTLQNKEKRGTMGILTRRDIAAGEIVTISYYSGSMELGSRHRQVFLLSRFNFVCACTRCMDPSEFGTYYSAIKCKQCEDGWFLPPTSYSEDNQSRCNECDHSMTSREVEQIEFNFRRKMVAGMNDKRKQRSKVLDNLIWSATWLYRLHPNHNLVIEAIIRWLAIQNFKKLLNSTNQSRILYKKIMERAERCLAVINQFGKVSEQAELEAKISCAMIHYHFKSKDALKIRKDIDNPAEKIVIVTKIINHFSTAATLLSRKILYNDTSVTDFVSMTKRCDLWKKHLLEVQQDLLLQKSRWVFGYVKTMTHVKMTTRAGAFTQGMNFAICVNRA